MNAFRLIVPTRDSASWIGIFLDAYRRMGVEPLYVLDARSDAATFDVLRAQRAHIVTFAPAGDFVEAGMIEFGARHAGTPWVLRIDDDEFPSAALLRWVAGSGTASRDQAVAFSRRELFLMQDRVWYSRSRGRFPSAHAPDYLGPQVRLHHVARVRYRPMIHTHGFEALTFLALAPHDAFFIHCSALLRSPAERWEKLQRYEAIQPGSTICLGDEYLPELYDAAHHRPACDGLDEFAALFAALPIRRNAPLPDLAPGVHAELNAAVRRLHDALDAEARTAPRATSAKDVGWLHRLPRAVWRPLAGILRGIGGRKSRLRRLGELIRTYERMHRTP